MKKYVLLAIPLLFFKNSILYFDLDGLINHIIILACLTVLLKLIIFNNLIDWIVGILFAIYFCILYSTTVYFVGSIFLQSHRMVSIDNLHGLFYTLNLIPFKSIIYDIENISSNMYQFLGNIIMLVPLAFSMLYFKWAKSYKQAFWFSFLCTVDIELIQFLYNIFFHLFSIGMNRSTDIDDIILNVTGAVIGMGCYVLWLKMKSAIKGTNE